MLNEPPFVSPFSFECPKCHAGIDEWCKRNGPMNVIDGKPYKSGSIHRDRATLANMSNRLSGYGSINWETSLLKIID